MTDQIIRATASGAEVRAFAASTRDLVEAAHVAHGLSPVATAALGRLLTAGAMMGCTLKNKKDLLTIQIRGDGPIGGLTVTADSAARVKGYANNPIVMLPPITAPNKTGDGSTAKLNVGGAVGKGYLQVIKDLGLKEPYSGQVELKTGEIAEDLTYYFAASEQTPSIVGLGVLMEKDESDKIGVKCAGGFIVQVMPFATEQTIKRLEEKIQTYPPVTQILQKSADPIELLNLLLGDMDLMISETIIPEFYCNCDRKRVEKALISIGKDELGQMIEDNETIEVKCHFCNKAYHFTLDELLMLRKLIN
jgi:molecular chaperone Hsp33